MKKKQNSQLHQIAKAIGNHYNGYVDPIDTPESWASSVEAAQTVLQTIRNLPAGHPVLMAGKTTREFWRRSIDVILLEADR